MPTLDFVSAATRHLGDASKLHGDSRFDNSTYHAGYVVECSLKAVVARTGVDPKTYGHRLLKLQRDGLAFAALVAPGCVRYTPDERDVRTVNDKWSESMRYSRTGDCSPADSDTLVRASGRVWDRCIAQMFLDGLIEEPR